MDILFVGGLLLLIMMVLLSGGVWIAMTLAICGWVGQAFFTNTQPGKNLFSAFWESNASWELAALPLFIWMGEILFRTKLSEEMFEGLRPWLNRVPGRLMHTTILGCGIFGSVSGSSAATCATISKVALPELLKRGYSEKLALGSLATAGTLGILIPPSITMVVYAVAADASIIRIFLAGFLPGLLLMALFSGYIMWWSARYPDRVPAADPPSSLMQKIRQSGSLIPCGALIVFICWVLIAGYATATDLADYLVKKGLPFRDAHEVVAHAVKTAQAQGKDLSELPLNTLQQFNPTIAQDVFECLSLQGSLNARNTLGGTAPAQVRAQIARHQQRLG